MILYKFQTPIKGTSIEKDLIDHCGESDLFRSVYRQTPGMMRSINEHFLIDFKHDRKALPLLVDADSKYLYGAAAVSPEAGTADVALEMVSKSISGCSFINTCEISREEYMEMIELSSAEEFVNTSVRNIFDQISLYYNSRRGLFEETPFEVTEEFDPDGIISYAEAKRRSAEILASDDFKEEIDRIYSRKNLRKYMGHPVHYVISAGDYAAAMDMIHILVPALRKCNRLLSGRVSQMRKINQRAYRDEGFERFFESESGATVVIDFSGDDTSGNMASSFVDLSRAFARMVENTARILFSSL